MKAKVKSSICMLVIMLCALSTSQNHPAFCQNDSRSLGTKGNALLQQNRFGDAEDTFTAALKCAREEHNEKAIAGCLYNLSLVCGLQSKYDKAQKLLNELKNMKSHSAFVSDDQLKKQQSNIFYGQAKYADSEAIDKAMLASTSNARTSLEVRLHQRIWLKPRPIWLRSMLNKAERSYLCENSTKPLRLRKKHRTSRV